MSDFKHQTGYQQLSELQQEIIQARRDAEVVHDEQKMSTVYEHLSHQITEMLAGSNPVLLPVMMGGLYLCGQLMQRLDFPLEIDYLHATRYRDRLNGDDLHWPVRPSDKIAGRTVLIIDDILDQGVTLAGIIENVKNAGAKDVYSAVLTRKLCQRKQDVDVSFSGVDVPDRYVFGCGMDYKGYWRNLNQIYAVVESRHAAQAIVEK